MYKVIGVKCKRSVKSANQKRFTLELPVDERTDKGPCCIRYNAITCLIVHL